MWKYISIIGITTILYESRLNSIWVVTWIMFWKFLIGSFWSNEYPIVILNRIYVRIKGLTVLVCFINLILIFLKYTAGCSSLHVMKKCRNITVLMKRIICKRMPQLTEWLFVDCVRFKGSIALNKNECMLLLSKPHIDIIFKGIF